MPSSFDPKAVHLELLRTLLAAATARTFGEAAKQRGISTPAISQQIKALETQLGMPLFERVGRNARLTPSGAELVAVVRHQLALLDDAVAAFVEDGESVRGRVRIGGPAPFSAMWLRPRLVKLLKAHPGLRLDVNYGVTSVITKQLLAGDIDFGIIVQDPAESSIESRVVFVEQFVPVASPGYVRKHGMPENAAEFRQRPMIIFDNDMAMLAPWWRAAFGRREPMPANVVCSVTSLEDMRQLALQGLGIAVLPDYFTARDLAAGHLVQVCKHVHPERCKREARNPMYLCWRKGTVMTARLRAVLAELTA
ncbi:LysR family transcriptional regulator [Pendulispora brunnea]|uniref:LysR family transcriptional regulator n=1 Tax=Pendulispora brunnea TaxID=2905690 RepID=A0ABZ2JWN6_9BACT